jgi:carbamoyltransferase
MLGAEVQNYGIPGSGTDQHLLIYRKFARDVEADLVMICVQIDSFHRIQVSHRPNIDRVTGKQIMVPKPYFDLQNGELVLHQVPVPRERPEDTGAVDLEAGKESPRWYDSLHDAYLKVPGLSAVRHSPLFKELGYRAVSELNRATGKHPYPGHSFGRHAGLEADVRHPETIHRRVEAAASCDCAHPDLGVLLPRRQACVPAAV